MQVKKCCKLQAKSVLQSVFCKNILDNNLKNNLQNILQNGFCKINFIQFDFQNRFYKFSIEKTKEKCFFNFQKVCFFSEKFEKMIHYIYQRIFYLSLTLKIQLQKKLTLKIICHEQVNKQWKTDFAKTLQNLTSFITKTTFKKQVQFKSNKSNIKNNKTK